MLTFEFLDFSSWPRDIKLALLTFATPTIVGVWSISRFVFVKLKRRHFYKGVLGFDTTGRFATIFPTAYHEYFEETEFVYRLTFQESIYGLKSIYELFSKIGAKPSSTSFLLSDDVREEDLNANILVIGGPNHNIIAKNFLEYYADGVVEFKGHNLHSKIKNRTGRPKIYKPVVAPIPTNHPRRPSTSDAAHFTTTDYAVLAVLPNRKNPSKRTLFVAGCHGMASFGVLKGLSDGYLLKMIKQHENFSRGSGFWSVLKVNVTHPPHGATIADVVEISEYATVAELSNSQSDRP